MKALDAVVTILLIVGGINWGLVGFFQFDLVAWLFNGQDAAASRVIYALVGLCALYDLIGFKAMHQRWCTTRMVEVK